MKRKVISVIVFLILVLLGWYGGIDYEKRIPFNAAYVAACFMVCFIVNIVLADGTWRDM